MGYGDPETGAADAAPAHGHGLCPGVLGRWPDTGLGGTGRRDRVHRPDVL